MKLPSLNSAEGLVLIGAAGLIAYTAYKATKIAGGVTDTLGGAASSVGNVINDLGAGIAHIFGQTTKEEQIAANSDAQAAATQLQTNPIDYGTGSDWDDAAAYTAVGLGTDSRVTNASQSPSPDPAGVNYLLYSD